MNLTASDLINIALCVLSFFLAAISVVTVIVTLKQNSKMIENASRPYVGIHSEKTDFGYLKYFLILKNYGSSKATITDFKCDIDLSKYTLSYNTPPFEHIIGTCLMPQQQVMRTLDFSKLYKDKIKTIKFHIEYIDVKSYSEDISIIVESESEYMLTRNHKTDLNNEIEIISTTLQGIAEQML